MSAWVGPTAVALTTSSRVAAMVRITVPISAPTSVICDVATQKRSPVHVPNSGAGLSQVLTLFPLLRTP